MRRAFMFTSCVLMMATLSLVVAGGPPKKTMYTANFPIHYKDTLLPSGGNEFFSLDPGAVTLLEGEDDGQIILVQTTVLPETRLIRFPAQGGMMAVRARVVEEREWIEGELTQVSLNYFAACPRTGNIYNFGEEVLHYQDGAVVSTQDSWIAGRDGAKPGLLLPGYFLLGSRYHQEMAPGVSMDCAENIETGLTVRTPAGVFKRCITVLETTPLEPDEEVLKTYAPGVGLIGDGHLVLVDYHN